MDETANDNVDSKMLEEKEFEMPDLMQLIAKSHGISQLSIDTYSEISDSVAFVLKLIINQSLKFMDKNNHLRLTVEDIGFGMKSLGVEPIFSFICKDPALFKHGRGGNGCLPIADQEMELVEILNAPPQKIPRPCSIKGHWLAIEGIQPAIPENPIPPFEISKLDILYDGNCRPKAKLSNVMKQPQNDVITFPMTLEQQHYLQEITEACVGADENRRSEAFESLKVDTGLNVMLPRLCNFISEGVRVNVGRNNFAMLIYLMRMCKSLVDNSNLRLETYLHELLPPIITCIVSKQLCTRPDVDNHWALREYAARLLCQVCRSFNTGNNQLRSTVTKLLSSTLVIEETPLTTYFGALFFLGELGLESIVNFILPCVKAASERLQSILEVDTKLEVSNVDKIAAERIKFVLLKVLPPVILNVRSSYSQQEFSTEYGEYLGFLLFKDVEVLEKQNESNSQNVIGRTPSVGRNLTTQNFGRSNYSGPFMPSTPNPQKFVLISPQQRLSSASQSTGSSSGSQQVLRLLPSATNMTDN